MSAQQKRTAYLIDSIPGDSSANIGLRMTGIISRIPPDLNFVSSIELTHRVATVAGTDA